MKVFYDTSILEPASVDQLGNHAAALEVYARYTTGRHRGCTSAHALAECHSVLTSLPVPRRVSTVGAKRLIDESIRARLEVVDLDDSDYAMAIERTSTRGLAGLVIYDALHALAAEKAGCSHLYTHNVGHFRALCPGAAVVSAP